MPAIAKLRDSQTEQHTVRPRAFANLPSWCRSIFNALPQYFNAIQQQVMAAQQHSDAGLRAIIDILRPPQPDSSSSDSAVGGDWQEALLGGELTPQPVADCGQEPAARRRAERRSGGVRTGGCPASVSRCRGRQNAAAVERHWRSVLSLAAEIVQPAGRFGKGARPMADAGLRTGRHGKYDRTGQPGRALRLAPAQRRAAWSGNHPGTGMDCPPRQRQSLYKGQRGREVTISSMNTFRCSNCGFQIQRPTQPFSCPQCGRQAVGLFRVVAFTPPQQGGWSGQAAGPSSPSCRNSPGGPSRVRCSRAQCSRIRKQALA